MAQIKITDLPTDKDGVLNGIRRALVTVFGRCRGKTYRLELLADTLQFVVDAATAEIEEIRAERIKEVQVNAARKERNQKLETAKIAKEEK